MAARISGGSQSVVAGSRVERGPDWPTTKTDVSF